MDIKTTHILRVCFHFSNIVLWVLYLYINVKIDVPKRVDYVLEFVKVVCVCSILLLICLPFRASSNIFEKIIIDIITMFFTLGSSAFVSICILLLYKFSREFFHLEVNAQLYVILPFMYFALWLVVHIAYFCSMRSTGQQSNCRKNLYTKLNESKATILNNSI